MKIKELIKEVGMLLVSDDGHGIDHVMRVKRLAASFAEAEGANSEIVEIAALLHDVDDYKLFGEESAKSLANATTLLEKHNVGDDTKQQILAIIRWWISWKHFFVKKMSLNGSAVSTNIKRRKYIAPKTQSAILSTCPRLTTRKCQTLSR